jgi:tetratricopeptide (TPR) repeat protein
VRGNLLALAGERDEFPIVMSKALEIAVNVFYLTIIVGFAGWVLFRCLKKSDDPPKLIFKWIVTGVVLWFELRVALPSAVKGGFDAIFGLIVTLICGIVMTVTWRNSIIDLIANPIGSLYDGGTEEVEPKPYYSIALTKRKLNKPLEAVVEIRSQLAKFPNDFEGITLLANIQAEDMNDLASAEITLNHFCDSENPPDKQVAAALTQLADWHLKLAQDADSARLVLEKIIVRFPGTGLALQASQRIAHLGGVEKILLDAHDRQAVFVPEGVKNIGLLDSPEFLVPEETEPGKQAAIFVKHLEQHPLDTEVREKLAILYARHFKRLDLATMELAQLINEPKQPPKRVAHWLNLLADLQIHGGADFETVRGTLEKIVAQFPDLPVAEIARSRLGRLKIELKGQQETPGIKLGVYEQNIGLKSGRTFSPRQL